MQEVGAAGLLRVLVWVSRLQEEKKQTKSLDVNKNQLTDDEEEEEDEGPRWILCDPESSIQETSGTEISLRTTSAKVSTATEK